MANDEDTIWLSSNTTIETVVGEKPLPPESGKIIQNVFLAGIMLIQISFMWAPRKRAMKTRKRTPPYCLPFEKLAFGGFRDETQL
ncbi:hypothetical protein DdX_14216 [Ditylenchus destructor]|uniref:Uncharacterized protein n=1 Tax=Ditylenchus destructor TaxID=166010 RepID=A0AAD4R235_9BILA|nr:hypothetical protein DdX_14216 [Ditylenchus destructor]